MASSIGEESIAELNTALTLQSIMAFNTTCLVLCRLDGMSKMHESAVRLYEAAKVLGNVEGQSAVAHRLGESPQVVKNWETRGVSAEGAIAAERTFGCSPAWIRSGDGAMAMADRPAGPMHQSATLEQALEVVGIALAAAPEDRRDELGDALRQWARYGGRDTYLRTVAELLEGRTTVRSTKQVSR